MSIDNYANRVSYGNDSRYTNRASYVNDSMYMLIGQVMLMTRYAYRASYVSYVNESRYHVRVTC